MSQTHQCFGCQRFIEDNEPHIHLTLDDWARKQGLEPVGIDDELGSFSFCLPCTERADDGWLLEQHGIVRP